jgi:hypothetical protein
MLLAFPAFCYLRGSRAAGSFCCMNTATARLFSMCQIFDVVAEHDEHILLS